MDDWNSNINELVNQLKGYPIEGFQEALAVQDGKVLSIYPCEVEGWQYAYMVE